jgi:hypothetical protein
MDATTGGPPLAVWRFGAYWFWMRFLAVTISRLVRFGPPYFYCPQTSNMAFEPIAINESP